MSDLPFTLDQLRILHAISNEGSVKKAAEKAQKRSKPRLAIT